MKYVLIVLILLLVVSFVSLITGAIIANSGTDVEEERRKDDEAQIEYLKEWTRKKQEKKKRS